MINKKRLFDIKLHMILLKNCLKTIIFNKIYIILILSET